MTTTTVPNVIVAARDGYHKLFITGSNVGTKEIHITDTGEVDVYGGFSPAEVAAVVRAAYRLGQQQASA